MQHFDDDFNHFHAKLKWCGALEIFVAISLLIFSFLKLCFCVVFCEIETQILRQNQNLLVTFWISKIIKLCKLLLISSQVQITLYSLQTKLLSNFKTTLWLISIDLFFLWIEIKFDPVGSTEESFFKTKMVYQNKFIKIFKQSTLFEYWIRMAAIITKTLQTCEILT